MKPLRRALASFLTFTVLITSYQSALAGLPDPIVKLLNAANAVNSVIPSGDAVNNSADLLASCFGLFGPQSLDGCINALAGAGGATAQQQGDLQGVLQKCGDIATEDCIFAIAGSDTGRDILGELLPGADVVIGLLVAIRDGDIWFLVSKVGIDIACIAAEILTGGVDVCGVIKLIGEAIGAVIGFFEDVFEFVSDLFGDDDGIPLINVVSQNLEIVTQAGKLGMQARVYNPGKPGGIDADAYLESVKKQVFPPGWLEAKELIGPANGVWAQVKPGWIDRINKMWLLEIVGSNTVYQGGRGLKARDEVYQSLVKDYQEIAAGGKANALDGAFDCAKTFQYYIHIDRYLELPNPPQKITAETSAQLCAKLLPLRAAADSKAGVNQLAAKEQKLASLACVKSGSAWTCPTWPAYNTCKDLPPTLACSVDRPKADPELRGRAMAAGNKGGGAFCAVQGSKVNCARDVPFDACALVVKTDLRDEKSEAACVLQYDAKYQKLVDATRAIVNAVNGGGKGVLKPYAPARSDLDKIGKTAKAPAQAPEQAALDAFMAKLCADPGRGGCVALLDNDPLVIVHPVRSGDPVQFPVFSAIYYEAGKPVGDSCKPVSMTAQEFPQFCFKEGGNAPSLGSRGNVAPVGLAGGSPTQNARDLLGGKAPGGNLGTGDGSPAGKGPIGVGGRNPAVDPRGATGGAAITGNNLGAGASLDSRGLQAQLDSRQLSGLVGSQVAGTQLDGARQSQTLSGTAPAGTPGSSTTGARTTPAAVPATPPRVVTAPPAINAPAPVITAQPPRVVTTPPLAINAPAPVTTAQPPRAVTAPPPISSVASQSRINAPTSLPPAVAAQSGGSFTSGMSSADRQRFAIACSASSRDPKQYSCTGSAALQICQEQSRKRPELGISCTAK